MPESDEKKLRLSLPPGRIEDILLSTEDYELSPFYWLIEILKNRPTFSEVDNFFANPEKDALDYISYYEHNELPLIPDDQERKEAGCILKKMRQIIKEESALEPADKIHELENLNERFLVIQKFISSRYSFEDKLYFFLMRAFDLTPKENFYTDNYMKVEEAALKLIDGIIDQEAFYKVLEELRDHLLTRMAAVRFSESRQDDETWRNELPILLLKIGLTEWAIALDFLRAACEANNMEMLRCGLDIAFNANKKFVILKNVQQYI